MQAQDEERLEEEPQSPSLPAVARRRSHPIRSSDTAPKFQTPLKGAAVENFCTISRNWFIEEGENGTFVLNLILI